MSNISDLPICQKPKAKSYFQLTNKCQLPSYRSWIRVSNLNLDRYIVLQAIAQLKDIEMLQSIL